MSDNDKKRPRGLDNADSLRPPKKRVAKVGMSFVINSQEKAKPPAKAVPKADSKKPKNKT